MFFCRRKMCRQNNLKTSDFIATIIKTIIHVCDKIFREIDFNEELQKILDELERLILI